jgi:TolB-like protein/Tfp pilus assembly protein PilF
MANATLKNFFCELKRRNVIRMAGLYLVGAWLVVQVAGTVLPMFGALEWLPRTIVVLLAIGFVPAVIFSWVFELTPEGLKREEDVAPEHSITPKTGRRMDRMIIVVLVLALGYFAFDKFALAPRREAALVSSAVPNESKSVIDAKSIAVLPFENLSEEKQNEYFADGVQDEILTSLARVADLKVISRTSVIAYRDMAGRNLRKIGQELGVAHLLEGSVQRAGNRVRVNAQLVDARNDAHLWAQTYDRDLADVFAIQSEIAEAIAAQLQAKLSASEKRAIELAPTKDLVAFDLYSRAKTALLSFSFSATIRADLFNAADLLAQAIGRDPNFFAAHVLLAQAHDNIYFFGVDHTAERLKLAEAAVAAALRLRPDAGESHLARAQHLYNAYLKYDEALAELEVARHTLPNEARIIALIGYIKARQGKAEESQRYLQRSLELDPRNLQTLQQLALSYSGSRRYAKEAVTLDRGLLIQPNEVTTKVARALIDLDWKADTRALHAMVAEIKRKDPASLANIADSWILLALAERDAAAGEEAMRVLGDNTFGNDTVIFTRDFAEGMFARMQNDQARAQAAFARARIRQEEVVQRETDYGPAVCVLAMIDAALGRKDEALAEGRRAMELLPIENDPINGAHLKAYFAILASWVGEKEPALEQLVHAGEWPGYATTSYGQLKLTPYWDELRGDPRFEQIVASLAPKEPPR